MPEPEEEPTHCPACKKPLERRPGMFFLKGEGVLPGVVCTSCHILYSSKEYIEALTRQPKPRTNERP